MHELNDRRASVSRALTDVHNCICETLDLQPVLPNMIVSDEMAVFSGKQEFSLTRDSVVVSSTDRLTGVKRDLIADYICPQFMASRSVLDLGGSSGYFSFWSVLNGACEATVVDVNRLYTRMVEESASRLGRSDVRAINANITDWQHPKDIVFAIDSIHTISGEFGAGRGSSLDKAVAFLSWLTKYMLFVEWVDPDDPMYGSLNSRDSAVVREHYTREKFEASLKKCFPRVIKIGSVNCTRDMYVAFKTRYNIDLTCPLPQPDGCERLISSQRVTMLSGGDYWSRVFDCGDSICKQTSYDLAYREGQLLNSLNSDYFPRLFHSQTFEDWSAIWIEKLAGPVVSDVTEDLVSSKQRFTQFVQDCLVLLGELEKAGVQHRNILPDHIFLRDSRPVLIDFGWSVDANHRSAIPKTLPRPADGLPCDVYSMGMLLDRMGAARYPELSPLFRLMSAEDPDYRITSSTQLIHLFNVVVAGNEGDAALKLLRSTATLVRRNSDLIERNVKLEADLKSSNSALAGVRVECDTMLRRVWLAEAKIHEQCEEIARQSSQTRHCETLLQELRSERAQIEKVHSEVLGSRTWKLACGLQQLFRAFVRLVRGRL